MDFLCIVNALVVARVIPHGLSSESYYKLDLGEIIKVAVSALYGIAKRSIFTSERYEYYC